MPLTMPRYARQAILPELGEEGQRRLLASSVLCIGAGGLGSPALLYLAAAGIGRIGIVDDDVVEVSNLQRQVLFREADQGVAKADRAAEALKALNSGIRIESHAKRFTAANAGKLLETYDVILDGTDNFASKFLINDACVKFGKPLVYGSILGFEAQVSVFWASHGPCYRCLHPKPPSGHIPNCAEAGVIGAMAGIAGTVQALEAVKMALGLEWCEKKGLQPLLGRLWLLDARSMETRSLALPKNPACSVCSQSPKKILLHEEVATCRADVQAYSPAEAAGRLGSALFLDVREAHELASGMIAEARHIPLGRVIQDAEALDGLPKTREIIVYCQHGIRSLAAARHLQSQGYGRVAHLEGGIVRWQGALTYPPRSSLG